MQSLLLRASRQSSDISAWCSLSAVRGYYFPRKNWFPWRTRIIHQRQAAIRQKRHIWPRYRDENEAPIFYPKEDGSQVSFRDKEIKISLKKMLQYVRIIRNRQLQDAIDWLESMARPQCRQILKLLRRALTECVEKHKFDIARVYIFDAQPQRGYVVKSVQKMGRMKYGVRKSPRHMCMIRVRQMPLEEYFHRVFIFNKIPRSLASDMRLALQDQRVGKDMIKEWSPYINARGRMFHRRELKWLDCTRQFDYYKVRREWIQRYEANRLRSSVEAREARGLPPLLTESAGGRQL